MSNAIINPLQVRASNLYGFDQAVRSLGGDHRPLFEELKLDPGLIERPNDLFAFVDFNRLLNLGAERLDCPYFGVLCAKMHESAPFDTFLQIIKRSPNLAAAQELSERYRGLESEVTFFKVVVEEGLAIVHRFYNAPFHFDTRQHRFFTLTRAFVLGQLLLREDWRPQSISFSFSQPGPGPYERLFGTPVYFNREADSYCFPEEDLYLPLRSSDEELLDILQNHADQLKKHFELGGQLKTVVRKLIQQGLSSGNADLNKMSELLNMHPRALQRGLLKEGISFKALLLQTRMEIAQELLLNSDILLTEISELIAYSELSAFSRAFKRYSTLSPEEWRKRTLEAT
ncbi:helix-turn-helix transcriptional regulator [Pseudoteredinibacter isoporae]|uniref:helix-turn-helix transcriptional regulator n=1 Tax=Pseudoteredinibacter isoporae TaxID=570281 RepID=UPI003108D7EC